MGIVCVFCVRCKQSTPLTCCRFADKMAREKPKKILLFTPHSTRSKINASFDTDILWWSSNLEYSNAERFASLNWLLMTRQRSKGAKIQTGSRSCRGKYYLRVVVYRMGITLLADFEGFIWFQGARFCTSRNFRTTILSGNPPTPHFSRGKSRLSAEE